MSGNIFDNPYIVGMERDELARRIRVAREYGGFESRPELAAELDQAGMSSANLGRIERGEKVPSSRDLKEIAEACSVPAAWLLDEDYDPFIGEAESRSEQLDRIEELAALIPDAMQILRALATSDFH